MSHGTKFNTLEVKGRKIDLFVSNDGRFNTTISDVDLEAETVEKLRILIEKQLKKPLSISFLRNTDDGVKRGIITGFHASNGNLLVKWEGEKGSHQEYPFGSLDKFLRLNAEQETEYRRLCKIQREATDAVEAFEKKYGTTNIREVVESALATAV